MFYICTIINKAMKQIKFIFLILAFLSFTKLAISQQDKIEITHIGMLCRDNHICYDGGMGTLELVIEKCKVRNNKIKLKGHLINHETKEKVYFYNIYLAGKELYDYRLAVKDTLMFSRENHSEEKLLNSFSISTKLRPNEALYFKYVGYGMLKIVIKDNL